MLCFFLCYYVPLLLTTTKHVSNDLLILICLFKKFLFYLVLQTEMLQLYQKILLVNCIEFLKWKKNNKKKVWKTYIIFLCLMFMCLCFNKFFIFIIIYVSFSVGFFRKLNFNRSSNLYENFQKNKKIKKIIINIHRDFLSEWVRETREKFCLKKFFYKLDILINIFFLLLAFFSFELRLMDFFFVLFLKTSPGLFISLVYIIYSVLFLNIFLFFIPMIDLLNFKHLPFFLFLPSYSLVFLNNLSKTDYTLCET